MDTIRKCLISVVLFVPNLGFLSDSLFCFHCTEQDDIKKCKGFIPCQDSHEACFLHRQELGHGNVSYTTGCLAQTLCNQVTGADDKGNCIQCCFTSFCNNNTQQLCSVVTTQKPRTTPPPSTTVITTSSTTKTTEMTSSTTTPRPTTTAPLPCVDNPNVDCKVVAPDVCGKDDHFTFNLCRRTCRGCGHHGK